MILGIYDESVVVGDVLMGKMIIYSDDDDDWHSSYLILKRLF